jgi:hypothetical protein
MIDRISVGQYRIPIQRNCIAIFEGDVQKLANRDVICAAILVLFSVAAWMQAVALSSRAAMFPQLVISLLLGFSVIYLLRSLWRASGDANSKPFFVNATRFVIALLLIAVYISAFPYVGFFTSTFIFIPIFSIAIGLRNITSVLIGSTIFTASAWVVFVVLLGRRLPPEALLSAFSGGGM